MSRRFDLKKAHREDRRGPFEYETLTVEFDLKKETRAPHVRRKIFDVIYQPKERRRGELEHDRRPFPWDKK